jgi:hypothetical protein
MHSPIEPLVADLVEWIAGAPRAYREAMEAWRTSCPRLTVWEEAVDRGLICRRPAGSQGAVVEVTPRGREFLAEERARMGRR